MRTARANHMLFPASARKYIMARHSQVFARNFFDFSDGKLPTCLVGKKYSKISIEVVLPIDQSVSPEKNRGKTLNNPPVAARVFWLYGQFLWLSTTRRDIKNFMTSPKRRATIQNFGRSLGRFNKIWHVPSFGWTFYKENIGKLYIYIYLAIGTIATSKPGCPVNLFLSIRELPELHSRQVPEFLSARSLKIKNTIWLFNIANWKIICKWTIFHSYVK